MSVQKPVLSEESLSCPVCLEIFKNPVTIPCGHNFCMDCISSCWDEDSDCDTCKCPECRQDFSPRPLLAKNIVLCKIVERLQRAGEGSSPDSRAAPGEVPCDFCTDTKLKATKSCVACMASFCELHLRSHYEDAVFRHHQLDDLVRDFEKRRCPEHGRPLEFFCRTNQSCLCSVCAVRAHRDHDTVTVEEEVSGIKIHIAERQAELERDAQLTLGEIGKLRHSVELFDEFHERLKSDLVHQFAELMENVEQAQSQVMHVISMERRTGLDQASRALSQMEHNCTELNREKGELEAIARIGDSFELIQDYHSAKIGTVSQVLPHAQLMVDVKLTDLSSTVAALSNLVKTQLVKGIAHGAGSRALADDEMEASWCTAQSMSGSAEQTLCPSFVQYSDALCQCGLTAAQHKEYPNPGSHKTPIRC
uniref:E3 ubiquitin/ISG15 ligase TRIM25-like isoform X2 n=1 Tax=Pristiophorus japonicus TaxID=55135 RepID=UPI00398E97E8